MSSLQQQRSTSEADKQNHEKELMEVKTAFQQVCEALKKSAQQNLELKRQCQSLEANTKEQEEHIKVLGLFHLKIIHPIPVKIQKSFTLFEGLCTFSRNYKSVETLAIFGIFYYFSETQF